MRVREDTKAALDPGRRANSFDQIRLAAAAAVVLDHAFSLLGLHEPSVLRWNDRGLDLGGLAVAIFFIISGYLVTASWLNEPSITAFARKRAARIWPGLIAVVFIAAFVVGPAVTTLPLAEYLTNADTWSYLRTAALAPVQTSLPGVFETNPLSGIVNVSLWTLPIEVLAYAVLVVVAALSVRNGRRWLMPALAVVFTAASYTIGDGYTGGLAMLLAVFFMGSTLNLYGLRRSPWIAMAAVAALVATLGTDYSLVGFAALVYLVLYAATGYVPALRHTARFGDPSYGMYIYGVPIGQVLILLGVSSVGLMFALSLPLSLAAGYASWHLIEKPALRWLKTLGDRPAKDGRPVLGVAAASIR